MPGLIRNVYLPIWRRAIGPLVVFEAGLALATLLLLDPLRVVLIDRLVAFGVDPFVGNTALVAFVLSPLGMTTLAVAGIAATLLLALEVGGIGLILWRASRHEPLRVRAVATRMVARLPALVALSALVIAGLVLLALPVAAVGLAGRAFLLSDADIYFYVTTQPPAFLAVVGLVGVAALAAAVAALGLLVRYGLAVPIALIEPVTIGQALRDARTAVRGREAPLARRLVVVFGLGFLLLTATGAALAGLYDLAIGDQRSLRASMQMTVGFGIVGAVVLAFVGAVFRIALVTVLVHAYAETRPASRTTRIVPAPSPLGLRAAAVAAGLVALASLGQSWSVGMAVAADRPIGVTAHRAGSSHAPENTLAALERAIAHGADVVEIDVQETRDGHVVVLHDTDLRRVAGRAASVWELDLVELQALDVGAWFAPEFAGERIPTLEEFAAAARGRVRLNVELKVSAYEVDLARRTLDALRAADALDEAALSSLDPRILARARDLAPEVPLGLIVATGVGNLARFDADFFPLARRLATPALVRNLHARGREVHVWGLHGEDAMAAALLDGADNLIVGDPLQARAVSDWYAELTVPERMLLRLRSTFALRPPGFQGPPISP